MILSQEGPETTHSIECECLKSLDSARFHFTGRDRIAYIFFLEPDRFTSELQL